MDSAKQTFLKIFGAAIHRPGNEKLLEYLERSDFFLAPASSKYHNAIEGGLCLHSINVYHRLVQLVKDDLGDAYAQTFSDETLAVVALLHDLCKVNFYRLDFRNAKENGVWVTKPYYVVDEKFPYGHGEKSAYIVNEYMRITPLEAMAINWHMGGFDNRVMGGSFALSEAFAQNKLAVYLHAADLLATYIDEDRPTAK